MYFNSQSIPYIVCVCIGWMASNNYNPYATSSSPHNFCVHIGVSVSLYMDCGVFSVVFSKFRNILVVWYVCMVRVVHARDIFILFLSIQYALPI